MDFATWTSSAAVAFLGSVGGGGHSTALPAGRIAAGSESLLAVWHDDVVPGRAMAPDAPASALVYRPLTAASPDGGLRVTVVSSHANADRPRTVFALVARRDRFVEWVGLPMAELPETVIVPNDRAIVCAARDASEGTVLFTFDADGRYVDRTPLNALLPPTAERDAASVVTLAASHAGRCLAVPLACGGVALIDFDPESEPIYRLCSVERAPKHACGIDAWLGQARDLLRDGDVEAARFALEAAIESEPNDPRGYLALAQLCERIGDDAGMVGCLRDGFERAHADVEDSVTGDWQVGTPHARLALDYVESTRSLHGDDRAHDALAETMALYPCMEEAVLLRAELFFDAGERASAIASLEHALSRLGPSVNVAAAFHDVGRFLARRDEGELALRFLEDAYALGDTSEFLIRSIAGLRADRGEFDVAADWLDRLADRWRSTSNGDSELTRTLRGFQRLAELEREILALRERAVAAPPR
ncbi:MAG: tetratricopeptide repeat protein [Planctomycetota bacterium]